MRFVYAASTALLLLIAQPVSAQFLLCPDSVELSHCDVLTYTVGVDTGAVASSDFTYSVSTTGSGSVQINSDGDVEYVPFPYTLNENPVTITVIATDTARALTDTCETFVTITNNPPVFEPIAHATVVRGQSDTIRIIAADSDACDALVYSLVSVTPQPNGSVTVDPLTGELIFSADNTDAPGHDVDYQITVAVLDGQTTDTGTFTYTVLFRAPFVFTLTQSERAVLLGHPTTISLIHEQGTESIGSFDVSILFDPLSVAITDITAGPALLNAGWSALESNISTDDTCTAQCFESFLRLSATAPPSGTVFMPGDTLAVLSILLTNDRNLGCQFIPLRWNWQDCDVNTLRSPNGDTAYQSRKVLDYVGTDINSQQTGFRADITGMGNSLFGVGGRPAVCDSVSPAPASNNLRFVDFQNGGIKTICGYDPRGDLDLNFKGFEEQDLELYIDYFTQGPITFDDHFEQSRAGSETNRDGRMLTVSDMVYMIRVIHGSALPTRFLTHDRDTVTLKQRGDDIISDLPLGALHLVFEGKTTVAFDYDEDDDAEHHGHDHNGSEDDDHHTSPMTLETGIVDGNTHVLIYDIGDSLLHAGEILDDIHAKLISADASDFNGSHVVVRFDFLTDVDNPNDVLTPETFELRQNYPNPFNPTTTIEFALPKRDNVELSIYNMLGQRIRTLVAEGMSAGIHRIIWDGQNSSGEQVASGMYLYRLKVGESFSATRKMVLLK